MLIYVNITDRQTDGRTDKHIKSIVRKLIKFHKLEHECFKIRSKIRTKRFLDYNYNVPKLELYKRNKFNLRIKI